MSLERSISLPQAIIYGVGVILGAGIYALIGAAAGITGPALWLSFICAAVVASLTAYSYAELSARFPKEGAESIYAQKAFKSHLLSFMIGIIFLSATLFSVAAVAWGFATYAKLFITISPLAVALVVIIATAIINHTGIQESALINTIFTLIEALGLILIIIFGIPFIGTSDVLVGPAGETGLALIPSIIAGIAIVFFAFLGFEGIVNISEEVKNAKRIVPKAILFSLIISTIMYVLVALVSVSVVLPSDLAASSQTGSSITKGPLALVADIVIGDGASFWLSIIALFATVNTVLILLIIASRYVYGLSRQHLLPRFFALINYKTKTPTNAIVVTALAAMVLVGLGNLTLLGHLTTMSIFLLFLVVNVSLIAIRFQEPFTEKTAREYIAPFNIGRTPLSAVLGALFCAYMFLTQYWEPIPLFGFNVPLIVLGLLLFSTSIPMYYFFQKKRIKILKK